MFKKKSQKDNFDIKSIYLGGHFVSTVKGIQHWELRQSLPHGTHFGCISASRQTGFSSENMSVIDCIHFWAIMLYKKVFQLVTKGIIGNSFGGIFQPKKIDGKNMSAIHGIRHPCWAVLNFPAKSVSMLRISSPKASTSGADFTKLDCPNALSTSKINDHNFGSARDIRVN